MGTPKHGLRVTTLLLAWLGAAGIAWGAISGFVRDHDSGAPLGGVRVHAWAKGASAWTQ